MKWCEASQQWFMYKKGSFVMKFPDCENMNKFFDKKLNKEDPREFEINISLFNN